ncbi:unnamed protein product [Ambrosiozyma monospora]|uniref:Unnamed protein product n=1 Tax=Ambrosiozyma monospora TaxID=43982 RepID=A0ACB5T3C5_AMBMO|nr:unnamed protein product [Ambrosiozyma monospora]
MGSSSNNNPISSRPSSTVLSGMLNPMANSPRTSYAKETTISPVPSHSSLQSLNQGLAQVNFRSSVSSTNSLPPMYPNQQQMQQRYVELYKSIDVNLDIYFSKLHNQFPILPSKQVISDCLERMEIEEHMSVIELFSMALKAVNSSDINNEFAQIIKGFEQVATIYASKSYIYKNEYAKIIFLHTLVLMNYAVILSGHDYSLGFGVSFSIMKDWVIFKEGFNSLGFRCLITMLIMDNIYALYFGTPRSSTLCFSIDETFVRNYLNMLDSANGNSTPNKTVDGNFTTEFLKIGLHLIVLSNQSSNEEVNKPVEIKDAGNDIKFLNILKITNELYSFYYNLSMTLQQQQPLPPGKKIDDFIFETELEITKICKKIINLIDEQLDDFEIYKIQPLLSLIVLKCFKVLKICKVVLESLMQLNKVVSNENFNSRLVKLMDSVQSNNTRLLSVALPNQLIKNFLNDKYKSDVVSNGDVIKFVKTSLNNSVDHLSVLQNWCRASNVFLVNTTSSDSMNGWYS